MASRSKKRKTLTLQTKHDILKLSDAGMKTCEIANEMDLARTTVSTIIKDKNRILTEIKTACSLNSTIIRKRHGIIARMEILLKMWCYDQVVLKQCKIDQKTVCNEAKGIFERLKSEAGDVANGETFVASNGWYNRFKQRCSILPMADANQAVKVISEEGHDSKAVPLPEIVEYRTEQPTVTQSIQVDPQPTVMEKIKMTKRILDKSKAAPVASSSAAEPASRSFADVGQVGQAASSASPVVEPASRGFSCGGRPLEKRPRHETAVDDDFDDDKMFLLSLCGKMKHLSPANNMQFRLGVQQLLFDLLRSESQTNLQNGSRSGNAFYTPATAQINPVSSSSVSSFSEVLIKEEVEETLTDESPLMVDESFPDEVKTEENSTERYSDNSGNMDYN